MGIDQIKLKIETAFETRYLGAGFSLEMAKSLDLQKDVSLKHYSISALGYNSFKDIEVVHLNRFRDFFVHLDELGYKFYLPAVMWHCIEPTKGIHEEVLDLILNILHPKYLHQMYKKVVRQMFNQSQIEIIVLFLKSLTKHNYPFFVDDDVYDLIEIYEKEPLVSS